jgi:adenylylsulfate kinase
MKKLRVRGRILPAHIRSGKSGFYHIAAEVLDPDVLRPGLCRDLAYSREDRNENIRRLARYARQPSAEKRIPLIAAIAPYRAIRSEIRRDTPWLLKYT